MKKINFMLVLFLLVVSVYGLYANGSSEKSSFYEGTVGYAVKNGTAVITDYTGSDGNLIIPETLGGYAVVSIGKEAFKDYRSLDLREIPESIISLEDPDLQDHTSLTSIEIPHSVTNIEAGAFFACTSLTTVTIPTTVTSIGEGAFHGCDNLIVTIAADSYAHEYVIKNGINFVLK